MGANGITHPYLRYGLSTCYEEHSVMINLLINNEDGCKTTNDKPCRDGNSKIGPLGIPYLSAKTDHEKVVHTTKFSELRK